MEPKLLLSNTDRDRQIYHKTRDALLDAIDKGYRIIYVDEINFGSSVMTKTAYAKKTQKPQFWCKK